MSPIPVAGIWGGLPASPGAALAPIAVAGGGVAEAGGFACVPKQKTNYVMESIWCLTFKWKHRCSGLIRLHFTLQLYAFKELKYAVAYIIHH